MSSPSINRHYILLRKVKMCEGCKYCSSHHWVMHRFILGNLWAVEASALQSHKFQVPQQSTTVELGKLQSQDWQEEIIQVHGENAACYLSSTLLMCFVPWGLSSFHLHSFLFLLHRRKATHLTVSSLLVHRIVQRIITQVSFLQFGPFTDVISVIRIDFVINTF